MTLLSTHRPCPKNETIAFEKYPYHASQHWTFVCDGNDSLKKINRSSTRDISQWQTNARNAGWTQITVIIIIVHYYYEFFKCLTTQAMWFLYHTLSRAHPSKKHICNMRDIRDTNLWLWTTMVWFGCRYCKLVSVFFWSILCKTFKSRIDYNHHHAGDGDDNDGYNIGLLIFEYVWGNT